MLREYFALGMYHDSLNPMLLDSYEAGFLYINLTIS